MVLCLCGAARKPIKYLHIMCLLGSGISALRANGIALHQRGQSRTIRFQPEDTDAYYVKIADATVTVYGKREFRTDLEKDRLRVEIFSGSVGVATPTLPSKLGEGDVLEHKSGGTNLACSLQKRIVKRDLMPGSHKPVTDFT